MHYYGTRLSENISRREPEGYLLCLNVPVARTGTQEYLPEELSLSPPYTFGAEGGQGGDRKAPLIPCHPERSRGISAPLTPCHPERSRGISAPLIPVYRPPEEVFSPETIASFEGMPVTNDHPPDGVDIGNIRALQKGHAHNVRRGAGAESDLLLADLIITDPVLIDGILNGGKREISCGYTYELCEENGTYIQRKIRGNHVAVVDAGRAGSRVSIKDHKPERRTHIMKKSLSKILARMAKDGDVETVAEILEEMIDPEAAVPETAQGEAPEITGNGQAVQYGAAAAEGAGEEAADEATLAGICERLDRIIGLLQPAAADEGETLTEAIGEAVGSAVLSSLDPGAEQISEVIEEVIDPALAFLNSDPAEDEDEEGCLPETLQTGDALRAALTAVRPVLAGMPKHLRRKAAADIAARLRRDTGRKAADAGVYAALRAAGRRPAAASADLGRRIMEKRNPHYKH